MTEHTNEQQPEPHHRARHFTRRTRFAIAGVTLVAVGAIAATALDATANGRHGWGHHGPMTTEDAQERALDKAEWILDAVQATPEQRTEVNTILEDLVAELHPVVAQHRSNREAFAAALMGPEVDSEGLEALRRGEIDLLDRASADAVQALARVAAVLTPEQRADLADRIGRFHRH